MKVLSDWIRVGALILACALPAQAGTWIVDQNGGPGSHFTDLPPAIAAAVPGDVILVRGGAYTPFTLTKGLAIIGTSGPWPTGTFITCCVPSSTVIAPPSGETVLLADLNFQGKLWIQSSAGVVVSDRLTSTQTIQIDQSADVRIHRHVGNGVYVRDSHFEIGSSSLHGGQNGIHGGTALSISGVSNGLVSRTSCIGGDGQDVPIGLPGNGGNGGYGIVIAAPVPPVGQVPTLLLAGGGVSTIQGGDGGFTYFEFDGYDADALYNYQSGVWRSGCTFIPGNQTGSGALPVRYVAGPGSFDTPISPDDPTLELVGTPSLGGSSQLEIHGPPGTAVRLSFGRTPMILFTPGIRVERLVTQDYNFFLGSVPPSGVITFPVGFWSRYPVGTALYAQASVIDVSGGETRRTNSVPLIVR